jgi:hypothetical protein
MTSSALKAAAAQQLENFSAAEFLRALHFAAAWRVRME